MRRVSYEDEYVTSGEDIGDYDDIQDFEPEAYSGDPEEEDAWIDDEPAIDPDAQYYMSFDPVVLAGIRHAPEEWVSPHPPPEYVAPLDKKRQGRFMSREQWAVSSQNNQWSDRTGYKRARLAAVDPYRHAFEEAVNRWGRGQRTYVTAVLALHLHTTSDLMNPDEQEQGDGEEEYFAPHRGFAEFYFRLREIEKQRQILVKQQEQKGPEEAFSIVRSEYTESVYLEQLKRRSPFIEPIFQDVRRIMDEIKAEEKRLKNNQASGWDIVTIHNTYRHLGTFAGVPESMPSEIIVEDGDEFGYRHFDQERDEARQLFKEINRQYEDNQYDAESDVDVGGLHGGELQRGELVDRRESASLQTPISKLGTFRQQLGEAGGRFGHHETPLDLGPTWNPSPLALKDRYLLPGLRPKNESDTHADVEDDAIDRGRAPKYETDRHRSRVVYHGERPPARKVFNDERVDRGRESRSPVRRPSRAYQDEYYRPTRGPQRHERRRRSRSPTQRRRHSRGRSLDSVAPRHERHEYRYDEQRDRRDSPWRRLEDRPVGRYVTASTRRRDSREAQPRSRSRTLQRPRARRQSRPPVSRAPHVPPQPQHAAANVDVTGGAVNSGKGPRVIMLPEMIKAACPRASTVPISFFFDMDGVYRPPQEAPVTFVNRGQGRHIHPGQANLSPTDMRAVIFENYRKVTANFYEDEVEERHRGLRPYIHSAKTEDKDGKVVHLGDHLNTDLPIMTFRRESDFNIIGKLMYGERVKRFGGEFVQPTFTHVTDSTLGGPSSYQYLSGHTAVRLFDPNTEVLLVCLTYYVAASGRASQGVTHAVKVGIDTFDSVVLGMIYRYRPLYMGWMRPRCGLILAPPLELELTAALIVINGSGKEWKDKWDKMVQHMANRFSPSVTVNPLIRERVERFLSDPKVFVPDGASLEKEADWMLHPKAARFDPCADRDYIIDIVDNHIDWAKIRERIASETDRIKQMVDGQLPNREERRLWHLQLDSIAQCFYEWKPCRTVCGYMVGYESTITMPNGQVVKYAGPEAKEE